MDAMKGTVDLKSSSFKMRNDACLDKFVTEKALAKCKKWAGKGLCSRLPHVKRDCTKSCNAAPSCEWMKDRWWVFNKNTLMMQSFSSRNVENAKPQTPGNLGV